LQKLRYEGLVKSLRDAGVGVGDVVHVQSDLSRIGLVDAKPSRESILEFFLAAFQEVVGPAGTISVGTSFEDYARFGVPFVLEQSPSRQGAFSEYVRTRQGAHRSLHPIVSISAIGARAGEICNPPHFDGFGYESAWGRLHRLNAKIVALGLGVEHEGGTTFFHYLEHLYGVPYQYTKVYETPVFAKGRQVEGTFTMSVRYLDYRINNDTLRFKRLLVQSGNALDVPVGRARMLSTTCEQIVRLGIECLSKDRYFLLAEPPRFRSGEIPMDGTTGPMQVVYDKSPTR
jgi:aminoglycoside 3-N-acetyltransferase